MPPARGHRGRPDAPLTRGRWAALLSVAVVLRLPTLLRPELWLDERVTVGVASALDPWDAAARMDLHPPLLAVLLAGLVRLSDLPWVLRLPSLLASLIALPVAARAGRAWGGEAAAPLAAGFVAVAGPWGLYGGEARPYALGALLVLAVLADAPTRPLRAGLWAALAALALYPAGLVAGVVLGVQALAEPRRARRWAALTLFLAAAALLAATLVPAQLAHQGADLRGGHLGRFLPAPGTLGAWALSAPLGLLGWTVGGLGGARAAALGLPVAAGLLALARRARTPLDGTASVVLLAALAGALAGVLPLGATRHALPVATVLGLWGSVALASQPAVARRAGAAAFVVLALLGRALGAGLPG